MEVPSGGPSSNAIGETWLRYDKSRRVSISTERIIYKPARRPTRSRVDAKSGRELWNTQIADLASGETVTMAPLVRARPRGSSVPSGGEFRPSTGWFEGTRSRDRQA